MTFHLAQPRAAGWRRCLTFDINRKAIDEYGMRATPNPNVLVELGYAAHSLGWDRIIVVVNTAHGAIEELPFDFRARRVVTYRFADEDKPAMARQELVGKLAGAIGPILGQGPTRRASCPDEPPPDRRHPLDIHSESPFAPLDAGRLVLPAPRFADIDTFWGFFAAEERRFAEERQSRAAFGFGGQDSQHFRDFLADPARFVDWYIYTHWRHGVVRAHLDLTNMGTTPAHNIDVRIELPPGCAARMAASKTLTAFLPVGHSATINTSNTLTPIVTSDTRTRAASRAMSRSSHFKRIGPCSNDTAES